MRILTLITAALLLFSAHAMAQNNIAYQSIYYSPNVSNLYFSGGFGSVAYSGDLGSFAGPRKSHGLFKGFFYGFSVGYQVTHYLSVRVDWNSYKHSSPDYLADSLRFGSFTAGRHADFSVNIVHDLTQKANIDAGDKKYSPYLLAGFGFTRHKGSLTTLDNADTDKYPELNNEEKKEGKMGVILPFGFGFRYYILHNVNLALEVRSAIDTSDMFDRVSNRANPKSKDKYILYGLKATWSKSYKFDYKSYRKKHYKMKG